MLDRRRFVALSSALALAPILGPHVVRAQAAWPSRFVKLIVPFAAGGAADIIARTISNRLSEVWSQQVVVENRGGGGANIGTAAVAQSDPDGYTMLLSSVGQAINRFLYPSLTYDPVADFAPVSLICLQPNIMVVPNASPAKSVKDFIAHAKANPDKISYGSGGIGTSVHLCGELFKRMTGIEMRHVPYRGAGPAMQDVVAGRIDVIFDNLTGGLPQVQGGSARGLAVTTARRSAAAPDIPTLAESGVPGFDVSAWFAFYLPARTPPDIVRKASADIDAALKHPPVRQRLEALGGDIVGGPPEKLSAFLKSEIDKWGPLIREANIKVNE
jgi:tripartite-type tricarboxylate transporter receptor subunit TctC